MDCDLMENEVKILYRSCVNVECIIDGIKKTIEDGTIILTNLRIIVMNGENPICLELKLTENEEFVQPIFGANFLKGTTNPSQGSGIANKISWKIIFYGQVGCFLPYFFDLLDDNIKKNNKHPFTIPKCNIAYIDPADPMIVLIGS